MFDYGVCVFWGLLGGGCYGEGEGDGGRMWRRDFAADGPLCSLVLCHEHGVESLEQSRHTQP